MRPEHLLTLATLIALAWSFGATLALLRSFKTPSWLGISYVAVSLSTLAAVLWLHSMLSPGRNSVVYLFTKLAAGDLHHVCAAGLGLCIGFGPALWPWQDQWQMPATSRWRWILKAAGLGSILCAFVFLSLLTLQEQVKPYVKRRSLASIVANPIGYTSQDGVKMEEYFDCDFHPLQIAIGPDGQLYATAYRGAAYQHGVVMRIGPDPATGLVHSTQVARSLGRPHGLAFYQGNLYVSRCGQYARAENGTLTGVNTGAVTLLKDLDGDGIMDYYDDIVSDLPGAQGPDPLHQNNGIVFSDAGELYITAGAHADRAPSLHPYEGTILRANADGSNLMVFARGLRNPFDVVIGPDQEVFCTDNDASDRRNGDELNHLKEGQHYGFPHADGIAEHPAGSISPLAITRTGTYQGIAYTDSPKLPEKYRNCLYIVGYGNGDVYRVRLHPEGASYRAEVSLFARVPAALDIAIDADGAFYVSCFHSKKIFRLTHREALE